MICSVHQVVQTFLENLLSCYKTRNFIHSKLITTQQTLAVYSSYVTLSMLLTILGSFPNLKPPGLSLPTFATVILLGVSFVFNIPCGYVHPKF